MENQKENQVINSNFEIDEEEKKRLRAKDSKKQLKAILITFTVLLVCFSTFTYFFFNYIEEKVEEYKKQQEVETKKTVIK